MSGLRGHLWFPDENRTVPRLWSQRLQRQAPSTAREGVHWALWGKSSQRQAARLNKHLNRGHHVARQTAACKPRSPASLAVLLPGAASRATSTPGLITLVKALRASTFAWAEVLTETPAWGTESPPHWRCWDIYKQLPTVTKMRVYFSNGDHGLLGAAGEGLLYETYQWWDARGSHWGRLSKYIPKGIIFLPNWHAENQLKSTQEKEKVHICPLEYKALYVVCSCSQYSLGCAINDILADFSQRLWLLERAAIPPLNAV